MIHLTAYHSCYTALQQCNLPLTRLNPSNVLSKGMDMVMEEAYPVGRFLPKGRESVGVSTATVSGGSASRRSSVRNSTRDASCSSRLWWAGRGGCWERIPRIGIWKIKDAYITHIADFQGYRR